MIQIFILVLYIYIYICRSFVEERRKLEVRGEAEVSFYYGGKVNYRSAEANTHHPLDSISVFHLLAALSAFCSAFKAGN